MDSFDKNAGGDVEGRFDRRTFLRNSGIAAGTVAGMAATSPLLSSPLNSQQPAAEAQEDEKKRPTSPPSLSRQFARWIVGLRYEDLPPAVVDRVKGLTLHAVTSALLGSQFPEGQEAVRLVTDEESGVRNGATIMVSGAKVTRSGAAFANSEMTLAGGKLDSFRMLTHPGTTTLPSAFVAAETEGVDGKDFITAVAAGYEVMERMAADFIPTVMARGFHASPVFGIFGGAVASAKVMRFTEDQVNNVIGLCVNLAGGNVESASLREGAAARNAMLAIALAKQGHPGGETALEGRAGFYHAYAGNNRGELTYSFVGDTETTLDKMTANLGTDWMLLETLYRIYSIGGYNLAYIDVTAKLCEENKIRYEDVDRVEAVANWLETQYPSPAFPTRREDHSTRIGSTRYYAAYAVVKRGFPMLPSDDHPPEVLELIKRVTIIPSHEMTLFGPRITIFTKDGKSYTKQATGREFIWDFDEEVRRVRAAVPGLPIPASQYDGIIDACRNLDQQKRAADLIQMTVPRT